LSCFRN